MRTALWGLAAGVSLWGSVAMGAATVPVTTLPWGTAALVQDPNQPVIYATVPSLNSVAVIDSNTLAVKTTIGIGSNPRGLTLSPDGSRLYVANSGSNFVGVIDTATRQALAPIAIPAVHGRQIGGGFTPSSTIASFIYANAAGDRIGNCTSAKRENSMSLAFTSYTPSNSFRLWDGVKCQLSGGTREMPEV